MPMRYVCAAVAVVLSAALPAAAVAGPADPQAPRQAGVSPGVVVEPIENGLVLAPEVKWTRVNGRDAALVGGYGGILLDRSLLIGAAGYWLSNGDRRLEMAYGGGLVGWYLFSGQAIDISVRALLGGGTARVVRAWSGSDIVAFGHSGRGVSGNGPGTAVTGPAYLVYEPEFLIAEPQLNLVWHIGRKVALDAGVSYRAIADANGFEKDLRGVAGSVSIRFGGGR
jgi:hypothetical protein